MLKMKTYFFTKNKTLKPNLGKIYEYKKFISNRAKEHLQNKKRGIKKINQ